MIGVIPCMAVKGSSLAIMWENSLLELWKLGCKIKTQYDSPKDPPSLDCTMIMHCENPDNEPAIHRCFPGGLKDLEIYRLEVIKGIKDYYLYEPDPEGTKWKYTYHDRLTNYNGVDQIDLIAHQLARSPYSRRIQAITWKVGEDNNLDDPPCLQSIWCRILEINDVLYLNMNVRFRSRDAYKAAFMNIWAFAGSQGLQGFIANKVSCLTGKEVRCGNYVDHSDSYHIYGKNLAEFETEFLHNYTNRDLNNRTYTRKFAEQFFMEARENIRKAGQ